ncbi:MAG: hypothetical protein K2W95_29895 [Candidatus Obscuribacterales bacterium]|nr:hypothetical protein [Candidatus Obscuribacterales bacterium]
MTNQESARQLAVRIGMMPRDTNGQGTISGGVLMCHIDLAAAVVARSACANLRINRMVTRAMDQVEFTRPVQVDDVLSCYGTVTRIGTTSVTVKVEVEVERGGETLPVTEATAVFVALDDQGKPTPICGNRISGKAPLRNSSPTPSVVSPSEAAPVRGERVVALRKYMLPAETNGMGNIFGGLLLTYMDMAGHYTARQACNNRVISRCVTRLMDKIEFKEPVHVNDLITCYGMITKVGRTSITVHIDVEAERHGEVIQVTQADLVFVAVNMAGRPVPVCRSGEEPRTVTRVAKRSAIPTLMVICAMLGITYLWSLSAIAGLAGVAGGALALGLAYLLGRKRGKSDPGNGAIDGGSGDSACGCKPRK